MSFPLATAVVAVSASLSIAKVVSDFIRTRRERLASEIHPKEFRPVTVAEAREIAPGVLLLILRVPEGSTFHLPPGKHVQLAATLPDGSFVQRSYTPVETTIPGRLDLLIRVYPNGKMGTHLKGLSKGDTVLMRGPTGKLQYTLSSFLVGTHAVPARDILMLAGGTGITPMVQIVKAVLRNAAHDRTRLTLVYASSTPEDVLLYHELCALAEHHREQFTLVLTVSRPNEGWGKAPSSAVVHETGRICPEMVTKHMPSYLGQRPFPDWAVAGYCGPPAFEACAKGVLQSIGFGSGNAVNLFRW